MVKQDNATQLSKFPYKGRMRAESKEEKLGIPFY
jgi:hypothetical protein